MMECGRDFSAVDAAGTDDASGAPFDLEAVKENCMGNVGVVRLVLMEFERQLAEDARRVETSWEGGDLDDARAAAHKLKGAAGIFTACAVQAISAEIEGRLGNDRRDGIGPLIAALHVEVERCIKHIPVARAALGE